MGNTYLECYSNPVWCQIFLFLLCLLIANPLAYKRSILRPLQRVTSEYVIKSDKQNTGCLLGDRGREVNLMIKYIHGMVSKL